MAHDKKPNRQQQENPHGPRHAANVRRFIGPEGIAAQDLPGGGRDDVFTDPGKEASRQLPQQHGGELGEEGGLRADRKFGGLKRTGGRTHS